MKTITQKDLQPGKNPSDGWFIIEAAGEHPHTSYAEDGQPFEWVQVLTTPELERIAAQEFPQEGMLVDLDHLSHDASCATEAYGWLRELAMCDGNLAGRIEWTPLGAPLVQGRVYRHFSTEYIFPEADMAAGRACPARLVGLALTNRPNNSTGQPPITNRCPEPPSQLEDNNTNPEENMNPEIIALLGLAEGATEEDVLNAIRDLKAANEDATAAEAESVVNAEECAAGVELTPEEKADLIEEVIANRETGLRLAKLTCQNRALVANRQNGTPRYPDRSNRASKPSTPPKAPDKHAAERAVLNRAKEICKAAAAAGKPVGFWTAKAQAQRELAK